MDGGRGQRVPDAQWSTAGARVDDQFGLWQQAVDDAFVPVLVQRSRPGAFLSEVSMHRLGPLEVSCIAAPSQKVSRQASHAESGAGVFFLNLPLSDGATVAQAGRSSQLSAGDFAVVDSDRPFELSFGADFSQISIKMPTEVLASKLGSPGDVVGQRVAGDAGVGAVVSATIRAAAQAAPGLGRRDSQDLADHIVDLVGLALGGVRRSSRSAENLLLRAARDEVERQLPDPGLAPALVAARIGISVRYLHRLFAEDGTSFGRWVLGRRVELVRRDLADPSMSLIPISTMARRRGFADPGYFARVFRSRYGLSPRQFREQHRR